TPEGGRIAVTAQPADGFVEIAVTDTGIGIAPEDTKRSLGGSGKGGANSRRKAEGPAWGRALPRRSSGLHAARPWVKSQPGQGSTFTFTLPVRSWPPSSS